MQRQTQQSIVDFETSPIAKPNFRLIARRNFESANCDYECDYECDREFNCKCECNFNCEYVCNYNYNYKYNYECDCKF